MSTKSSKINKKVLDKVGLGTYNSPEINKEQQTKTVQGAGLRKGGDEMETTKDLSNEQIDNTKNMVLKTLAAIPNNRQALFTAVINSYLDGIEAGTQIAEGVNKTKE